LLIRPGKPLVQKNIQPPNSFFLRALVAAQQVVAANDPILTPSTASARAGHFLVLIGGFEFHCASGRRITHAHH
jgi:hypothetical protein